MTEQDPRVATMRDRILHGAYDFHGSRHHPRCKTRSAEGDCNCYMQERQPALDALTSLARDARKAVLAEAVVERADRFIALLGFPFGSGPLSNPQLEASQHLRAALAAFRTEFPADPQEKP